MSHRETALYELDEAKKLIEQAIKHVHEASRYSNEVNIEDAEGYLIDHALAHVEVAIRNIDDEPTPSKAVRTYGVFARVL